MAEPFTERTHTAGGVVLMVAGVIGVLVGVSSLAATITPGVVLPGVPVGVAVAAGGTLIVVAVIEFAGGLAAYRGRNWYGSMTAGVLGLVTLVTLPLDLIGVILIALGEGQFDTAPAAVAAPAESHRSRTAPDADGVAPETLVTGTIPEVKERIKHTREPIDFEAAIEAERAGQNRVTLLEWLERQRE